MKNFTHNGEDGFSLLELVISIAVILVLTVGGLIGFGKYQDNARQAMVESAAQQSAKGALAYEANYDSSQTAEDAVEAYNASAKADTVSVRLERPQEGCMRFTATYKNHDNRAVREINCSNIGNPPNGNDDDDSGSNGNNTGSAGSSCNEVPVLRYTYKFTTKGSVRPTDYRIEDETGKLLTSGIVHIYTGDTYWVNYDMPCDEVKGWIPPQNKVILTGTDFGRVEFFVKPVNYKTYRYDGKPAGGADYLQIFDAGVFQISSDGVWNFNIDDCEKYKVCYEPYLIETR